jgi:VRR-NUC domain
MVKAEMAVDDRYRAEGWRCLRSGWPDRAYVRLNQGKLEVRFVEIKGPKDTISTEQQLMHEVLRSQGLSVQIEPPSKAPKAPLLPLEDLLKALEILEKNRQTPAI